MQSHDYDPFVSLLDDAFALNPAWKPLAGTGKAMFFAALSAYPLDQVRAALMAHLRDPKAGMFQPTPAHVVAQIEAARGGSGHSGADEAWSIAMAAEDEAETVVWTSEMSAAFAICRPVLNAGDKIGARMAFKDAYIRLVADSTRAGRAPTWSASLGYDPQKRTSAIERAARAGQLPAPQVRALLPGRSTEKAAPEGLARLKAAVAQLVDPVEKLRKAQEAKAEAEREALARLKAEIARHAQQVADECRGGEAA